MKVRVFQSPPVTRTASARFKTTAAKVMLRKPGTVVKKSRLYVHVFFFFRSILNVSFCMLVYIRRALFRFGCQPVKETFYNFLVKVT